MEAHKTHPLQTPLAERLPFEKAAPMGVGKTTIQVAALPGTSCTPDKPLAYLFNASSEELEEHRKKICSAFINTKNRTFSEDPRFGLIALTEIAVRALSSGDLFDDTFRSIAWDGASQLEVGIRLQKAFLALSKSSDHTFQKLRNLNPPSP